MKLFKMSLMAATTALLLQGCGGDGDGGSSSDDQNQNIDTNVVGMWVNHDNPSELLALTFLEDGSYIHMQVDAELNDNETDNGMEFGDYSVNGSTGELNTEIKFDENGDRGFSGGIATNVRIVNDKLVLEFDENENGVIDSNERITFSKVEPKGLHGFWRMAQSETQEFVGLAFLDDDNYVQIQLNDFDINDSENGMEWGTYLVGSNGLLQTETRFDANDGAGLSENATRYVEVDSDNNLILSVDGNANGSIEPEEGFSFTRTAGEGETTEPDPAVDTSHLSGLWVMPMSDSNQTIGLSFLDDGTYLQYQINGEAGDGVEWGKYSLKHDHQLVVEKEDILFDNNGSSGLSDNLLRYVRVSGNTLTLEVDNSNDKSIDPNTESYTFTKAKSENEFGAWKSDKDQPDSTLNQELVYMAFLDDNTLVYVEIDEKEPRETLDGEGEAHSGMQWNAYTLRNGTLTIGNSLYNDLGQGDLSDWYYLINTNVNGDKMNVITYEDAQKYQSGDKDSFWFTRQ